MEQQIAIASVEQIVQETGFSKEEAFEMRLIAWSMAMAGLIQPIITSNEPPVGLGTEGGTPEDATKKRRTRRSKEKPSDE